MSGWREALEVAETMVEDRLTRCFEEAHNQGRAALIGYLVGGDPDLRTSELVMTAAVDAGLDVLEVGIPYGDPLADGPTIAAAGQRALTGGTTLETCFSLVERLAQRVPIILFTYFNPVYQYGVERFAARAAKAGACGVIIPDIILEESAEVKGSLRAQQLAFPLLVAPTTNAKRASQITAASDGFVYVVSRLGVTGEGREPDINWLRKQVGQLRQVTDKPLAVGFGISTPAQVRQVAPFADGVIVGSALVASYGGASGVEAAYLAKSYVDSLLEELSRNRE